MNPGAYLTGKHAVVTGANGGIGRAIAAELAYLGATLTLATRNGHALEQHAAELRERYAVEIDIAVCDVSDPSIVADVFARAQHKYGCPYVLVNNAGCGESHEFAQTSREIWDRTLTVNLTGTFMCIQQVLPAMTQNQEGRIINIASTAALKGYRNLSAYCAAKHGLIGLTRALAVEVATAGITVNAVCPTYTADTRMCEQAIHSVMEKLNSDRSAAIAALARPIPRRSLVTTSEVVNAVTWLCSPTASAVTGQSIVVAGGEVM
jgi:NAD(P)-dependent dehydrogenase (short-subunit alcohol dehydrogenase family)